MLVLMGASMFAIFHFSPMAGFLATGGETLFESVFFLFSFFLRRVPPMESSLRETSLQWELSEFSLVLLEEAAEERRRTASRDGRRLASDRELSSSLSSRILCTSFFSSFSTGMVSLALQPPLRSLLRRLAWAGEVSWREVARGEETPHT